MKKLLKNHWASLLFFIYFIFVIFMDFQVSKTLLDGDVSEILLRGHQMAKDGDFFTQNWIGTSEPYLFNPSFIFMPFFYFIDNFTMVRFLGTIVAQIIYACSFYYLLKQLPLNNTVKWLTLVCLFIPFSTIYARLVVYHLHYITFLSVFFLIIGLILSVLRTLKQNIKVNKLGIILKILMAMLLLFLMSLSGIRFFLILLAPLLLTATLLLYSDSRSIMKIKEISSIKKEISWYLFLISLLCAVACLSGYALYKTVVLEHYNMQDIHNFSLVRDISMDTFAKYFSGILTCIGFRKTDASVLSISGIISVSAMFIFGYIIFTAFCNAKNKNTPYFKRFISLFFLVSLLIHMFVITMSSINMHYRYNIIPLALAALLLGFEIQSLFKPIALRKKITVLLVCVLFVCQGIYTNIFLYTQDKDMDTYNGIGYIQMSTVEYCKDILAFMNDNNYSHVIINYWYANALEEVADSTIRAYPYTFGYIIPLHYWGTSAEIRQLDTYPERMLIIIWPEMQERFFSLFPEHKLVYNNNNLIYGYEVSKQDIIEQIALNPNPPTL